MKRNHENSEDEGGKWLSTFNDMVTLLLTFFVLILSLSTPDTGKLKKVAASFNTAFGMFELGGKMDVNVFTPFVVPRRNKRAQIFEKNKKILAGRISEAAKTFAGLEKSNMDVKVIKEGVLIVLGEKLLFKAGMAKIEEENYPVLKTVLCTILKNNDCQIRVEGHTDDVAIRNERFSSNWEFSIARAVSVVKYFISEGGIIPERLSVTGYADSKPLIFDVNDHNRELNRRVEVILTLKKG